MPRRRLSAVTHLRGVGMAELTNLESKLGEVMGLAMAAQTATEKVSRLAADEAPERGDRRDDRGEEDGDPGRGRRDEAQGRRDAEDLPRRRFRRARRVRV